MEMAPSFESMDAQFAFELSFEEGPADNVDPDADAMTTAAERSGEETDSLQIEQTVRRELMLVDPSTDDYQTLLDDILQNTKSGTQIDVILSAEKWLENMLAPRRHRPSVSDRCQTGYERDWSEQNRDLYFFEYARPDVDPSRRGTLR